MATVRAPEGQTPRFDEMLRDLQQAIPLIGHDGALPGKEAALGVLLKMLSNGRSGITGAERFVADHKIFTESFGTISKLIESAGACCDDALGKIDLGQSIQEVDAGVWEKFTEVANMVMDFLKGHEHRGIRCDDVCSSSECPASRTRESVLKVRGNLRDIEAKFNSKSGQILAAIKKDLEQIVQVNTAFATVALAGSIWNLWSAWTVLEENRRHLDVISPFLDRMKADVASQASRLESILVIARSSGTVDLVKVVLLQMEVNQTHRQVRQICDGLQNRRDRASERRSGSLLGFGANVIQAVLMGWQGSLLGKVVEGANVARNLYIGAACVDVVCASLSHQNVVELDEALVHAKTMSMECDKHLRIIDGLKDLFSHTAQ